VVASREWGGVDAVFGPGGAGRGGLPGARERFQVGLG
jgi:hypothetical protein